MKTARKQTPRHALLALAIAVGLIPQYVNAQSQADAKSKGSQPADVTTLDMLVVSGTAQAKGVRKSEASYSITSISPEQIQEAAPTSTADLLKVVPGVWAESTGGNSGANVFVRGMPSEGDAPFLTLQLDGSPIFPPPTLSFLENTTLFRLDDTVASVEGLRGGPGPIFSNGQPGVTINFIQKKGDDTPAGSVRLTLGSNNLRRIDLHSSGRLGQDSGWYYSVGGFIRQTDGTRDPGFPSDKGGQLSAVLTKRWDSGELNIYARKTDDKNVFYTAVPLVSRNNGSDISSFPGIDATTGTLIGPDFRRVTLPTGIGNGSITRDLGDGRGVDLTVFGGTLDWTFGRWTISDKFNFLSGDAPTNGLFTGDNPQTLSSYISGAYGSGVTGTGSFVNGGGTVAQNQQVLTAGWWVVDKKLQSFTNDLRFSVALTPTNTLTMGMYYAKYSSKDQWWLGNNMLITAENHARRVNLSLSNGMVATRDGFVGTSFYNIVGDYDGRNLAFFVADEWNLSDRVRLDLGMRHEKQNVDGTVWDPVNKDLDGNPNTLYDNNTSVSTTPRSVDHDDSATSWTAGVNFKLQEGVSLFGRINSGFTFPQFDNLRDGATNKTDTDQYELGLKAGGKTYEMYLTAFYNKFVGLRYQAFDQAGNNVVIIGDSKARGLEFEGAVRPVSTLELAWSATWLKANYGDFADYDGNQVVRQPKFRARLTPSYYWSLPFGDLKLFVTYTYVGDRYSDPANGQVLPKYQTWDIGASAYVGDHWEFAFNARNITDEIGLTEGNARVIGNATTGGVFMGRPLEGRSYQLSAAYRW